MYEEIWDSRNGRENWKCRGSKNERVKRVYWILCSSLTLNRYHTTSQEGLHAGIKRLDKKF